MPVARGGLLGFLAEEDDSSFKLTAEQEDAVGHWFEHVWNFCTGTWPLQKYATKVRPARPILWTQDKMVGERRPFPHYQYLNECILEPIFMGPRRGEDGRPVKLRITVPKPRQFFCTNGILGGCLWDVLRNEATEWMIAKNKLPEAARFVKERVRFMYENLPRWFAGRSGPNARKGYRTVNPKPAYRFTVEENLSHITAVSRSFGETGEAIGETAKVLMDECIRLRNLPAVYDAADAQAPVIVLVSAPPERGARVDPISLAFFREMNEGLTPGTLMKTVAGRSDFVMEPDEDEVEMAG